MCVLKLFLTQPYKIFLSLNSQKKSKNNKNIAIRMLDDNNISCGKKLCVISGLQLASKLPPNSNTPAYPNTFVNGNVMLYNLS